MVCQGRTTKDNAEVWVTDQHTSRLPRQERFSLTTQCSTTLLQVLGNTHNDTLPKICHEGSALEQLDVFYRLNAAAHTRMYTVFHILTVHRVYRDAQVDFIKAVYRWYDVFMQHLVFLV